MSNGGSEKYLKILEKSGKKLNLSQQSVLEVKRDK